MHLIEDVKQYLEAQSETSVYIDALPMSPENAIAVIPSSGLADPGDPIAQPAFQVMCRGSEREETLERTERVYDLLHNKWNILSERNGRITASATPGARYIDEAKLMVYTLNFLVKEAP